MNEASLNGGELSSFNITDKITDFGSNFTALESVVPDWAKLLLESLNVLLCEFKTVSEGQRNIIIKHDDDIAKLNACYNTSGAVVEALVNDKDRLNRDIHPKLKGGGFENFSRRLCLLFHGIQEDEHESTDDKAFDSHNKNVLTEAVKTYSGVNWLLHRYTGGLLDL